MLQGRCLRQQLIMMMIRQALKYLCDLSDQGTEVREKWVEKGRMVERKKVANCDLMSVVMRSLSVLAWLLLVVSSTTSDPSHEQQNATFAWRSPDRNHGIPLMCLSLNELSVDTYNTREIIWVEMSR